MKNMKVWSIISTVFLLIVVLAVVLFFVWEKPIPASWVGDTVTGATEKIKLQTFDEIYNAGKMGAVKTTKVYSVEGGKRTLVSHTRIESQVVGQNDMISYTKNEVYDVTATEPTVSISNEIYYYIETTGLPAYCQYENEIKEEITQNQFKTGVLENMQACMPVNADGVYAYTDLLENNITSVTQKGFYVMVYAEKDNVRLSFAYDFVNRQLKGYTEEVDELDGDTVVNTSVITYEFTFPTSITLPEGA